jgi:hypothetical protein
MRVILHPACDVHTHVCNFDTLRVKLQYINNTKLHVITLSYMPAARMRAKSTLCAAMEKFKMAAKA